MKENAVEKEGSGAEEGSGDIGSGQDQPTDAPLGSEQPSDAPTGSEQPTEPCIPSQENPCPLGPTTPSPFLPTISSQPGNPTINTNPSPLNPVSQPIPNPGDNRNGTKPREICFLAQCFYLIPKDQNVAWTGKQKRSKQ